MTHKRFKISEFGSVIIKYASSQVTANFIRMAAGLLVVRIINPKEYGLFTGVGVYLGYVLLGQAGILNGLSRELPYEHGKNNQYKVEELASVAYTFTLLVSFSVAVIFLLISIYNFIISNYTNGFLYLGYSIIGGLHLLNNQYLPRLYFTNSGFNLLSRQNIILSIINLLTVLFVYFLGFWGLVIRGAVLAVLKSILLFFYKPVQINLRINLVDFKKLFKTGWPIFLVGHVNQIWTTVLNNIVFAYGGALNMGLFALSNIIEGAIGVIPNAFSSVIYPRMTIMFGEKKSVKNILKSNIKPLLFQFVVIVFVAIVGALSLPVIVKIILPNYTDGILAAQWMIFVPVAKSFDALTTIYNVVKKQTLYFVSLVSGALVGTVFLYIRILKSGFSLEFFPQSLLIGIVIQQILSILFIIFIFKTKDLTP